MYRILKSTNLALLAVLLLALSACSGGSYTAGGGYAPSGSSSEAAPAATGGSDPSQVQGTGNQTQYTYQSPLTAGEVDDNARFAEYLDYVRSYQGPPIRPISVEKRVGIRVVDGNRHPVAGAHVQLVDDSRQMFEGSTTSDGSTLFLSGASAQQAEWQVVASRGQQQVRGTLNANMQEETFVLQGVQDNTGPVQLDLVFLVDATGSMADEIAKIKETVSSIALRIERLPDSSAPRFGLVAYRDRGDEYVTRSWDFTGNVEQFQSNLVNVQAGGGGDTPESVSAGLHEAIHLPGWADNNSGRHLRMIVLVGDAPPHLDYGGDYEYTQLLQEAVASGIKIFPIGASGLDDQGEYIFRQFAQVTQGKFVFLTYANGVSGDPGVSTDHHVSNFNVQNLDSLIVSLVAKEIANQTGEQQEVTPTEQPIGITMYTSPSGTTTPKLGLLFAGLSVTYQVMRWLWNPSLLFWLLLFLCIMVWKTLPRKDQEVARLATPIAYASSDYGNSQTVNGDGGQPTIHLSQIPTNAIMGRVSKEEGVG